MKREPAGPTRLSAVELRSLIGAAPGGGKMNLVDIGEWSCMNYYLQQAEVIGSQAFCGLTDGSGSAGGPITW